MDGSVETGSTTAYGREKLAINGALVLGLLRADEIRNHKIYKLVTRLNGREVQRDSTANMIHSIAFLIAYISTFTVLSASDVILTGSPGGVGEETYAATFLQ